MQHCGFVRLYVYIFPTGVKEQREMQHYEFVRLYVSLFPYRCEGAERNAAL